MKKVLLIFFAGFLIISSASAQATFKLYHYNVYYNKSLMIISSLFANFPFNEKLSFTSYFYVNASKINSWGEGMAGVTYTPVKGISVGLLGGFQSNEEVIWRLSPIILLNKNHWSFMGAYEFGGKRYRWDNMGFYSWKRFKFGAELIRYYKMFAVGPRVEFTFFKRQPVTVYYSGLWDWGGSKFASLYGVSSTFGTR